MVMYDRRYQPNNDNCCCFPLFVGICVSVFFPLHSILYIRPIRFSFYTRCLSLYFDHKKKIKHKLFFSFLFGSDEKLFHLLYAVLALVQHQQLYFIRCCLQHGIRIFFITHVFGICHVIPSFCDARDMTFFLFL